jgi:acyl carrier protein
MMRTYHTRSANEKMTDIRSEVATCFSNVFPDLAAGDIPRASQASLVQWDSVAHVTLLSAISEEFQLDLDEESFESLTSYLLIVDFVESKMQHG